MCNFYNSKNIEYSSMLLAVLRQAKKHKSMFSWETSCPPPPPPPPTEKCQYLESLKIYFFVELGLLIGLSRDMVSILRDPVHWDRPI